MGMLPARMTTLPLILAAVVVAAPGCRSMGLRQQTMPEPLAASPQVDIDKVVDDINRNASLVQSLDAHPSVSDSDRTFGTASGRMVLVRPRDFKLTLSTPTREIANIGSNDQEFWIWSGQSEEKAIYVGRYESGGQLPPELAFQPDWVIEALGLRVIPPNEARGLTTERGDAPSTLTLVHHRLGPDGSPTIKKTTIDRATGQVVMHQFFGPDGRTQIARASVAEYQGVTLASGEKVILPNRIRLIASNGEGEKPQDFQITLGVSKVKLNNFPEEKRAIVFAVPEIEGHQIVDINQRLEAVRNPSGGQTASYDYETLPAPPAGRGVSSSSSAPASGGVTMAPPVRLERPQPLGRIDPTSRVDTAGPSPLSADLPAGEAEPIPGGIDAVVTPSFPRPPGATDTSGAEPDNRRAPRRRLISLE